MQPMGVRFAHTSTLGRQTQPVQFSGLFSKKKPEPEGPKPPTTIEDLERKLEDNSRSIRQLKRGRMYLRMLVLAFLGYNGYQNIENAINQPGPQGFIEGSMSREQLRQREVLPALLERTAQQVNAESVHFINLRNYVNPATVFISANASASTGGGSGWVYRSDGIIVTNQHVAAIAKDGVLTITLLDGSQMEGRVLGVDRLNDVAVIKVDRDNLPALAIRRDEGKPGELVMAVGHPHLIGWSSSVGTISGRNRVVQRDFPPHLLQTDASIAPGNSGGPLVDMLGNVVGMNQSGIDGMGVLGFSVSGPIIERSVQRILEATNFLHPQR